MVKRSQWTREEQRAVVPRTKVPPPEPPTELIEAERDVWRSIVAKLPGDWFAPECQPMLKELCRHIAIADELMRNLEMVRQALNALASGSPWVSARSKEMKSLLADYHIILRAHGYQTERIGNLATKLRLTNQAKIVASTAITKAKRMPPPGPAPWEDWGADVGHSNGS